MRVHIVALYNVPSVCATRHLNRWKRQYNHMLLRDHPEVSLQNSLAVVQDEQSPFNSRFLVACHSYSVQVEGLEEGQLGEQE